MSIRALLLPITLILITPTLATALDKCSKLPRGIQVLKKSAQCGKVPTVVLTGKFKNSFSAAFRWDDGSESGQDRSPFALNNESAASSPYKTQRRIKQRKADYLCYGRFLKRKGFPVPEQLTVKPSALPKVKRYCVSFSRTKR